MFGIGLVGSKPIELLTLTASSVQTAPDRSSQIVRMIKAHPIERRMLSEVGSR